MKYISHVIFLVATLFLVVGFVDIAKGLGGGYPNLWAQNTIALYLAAIGFELIFNRNQ